MDSFMKLFSLMILVCGVFCLYQAIYIYATGKLPRNCVILSKERPISSCLDPEQFLSYIKPRFLICSIVIVVNGAIMLLNDLTSFLTGLIAPLSEGVQIFVMELFSSILPLAALIWFGVSLSRAQKRFW